MDKTNQLFLFVEKHRDLILEVERYIWNNPETGYKEVKTSKYLADIFVKLGYDIVCANGITGFYTVLDTGKVGPEILVLAELDSVICPTHKEADPTTGAVHSCGHNAQCAALIGIAAALKEKGATDDWSGRIRFCAVPAEELLEIEYRAELKKQGKIKYFGGKTEFLSRGYFDGVDIAFMVHTSVMSCVKKGSLGCVTKQITYKGVASHAGGSPWNGKNALYAANCGLNAINAIRETFREEDIIRVHPIITAGGEMVNAIPDTVRLESYVRGKTFDAIFDANKKVNRAICGAALSLGLNVDICDFPGYTPMLNDKSMIALAKQAADKIIPDGGFEVLEEYNSGSSDMGDLSALMPIVHPYIGGAVGNAHGSNYYIENPEIACIGSTKMQLAMLNELLKDDAECAKKIISEFTPMFKTKEEFLDYIDKINSRGDRIAYTENEATVRL